MQHSGLASLIKKFFVPRDVKPRVIPFGLYKGINLNINFSSQTQIFFGLWERETYRVIREAVSESDWLMDVGAGGGELCLYFLLKNPQGYAVAIEPSEAERSRLYDNFALNDRVSGSKFKVVSESASSFVSTFSKTLDSIDVDHDQCGFVKIDVDGHEVEVLSGSTQLLSGAQRKVLVEIHSKELEQEVINILERFGFVVRVIHNAWWRVFLPEKRPIGHNRWVYAVHGGDRVFGQSAP